MLNKSTAFFMILFGFSFASTSLGSGKGSPWGPDPDNHADPRHPKHNEWKREQDRIRREQEVRKCSFHKQCGCHKGYCWSYKYSESKSGDPWCYTQNVGVIGHQNIWAHCNQADDCKIEMSCGNNKIYFGDSGDYIEAPQGLPVQGDLVLLPVHATAKQYLRDLYYLRCDRYKNGSQCGCQKGYCWSYKFDNSVAGDPWCYTQPAGVPPAQGKFATCNTSEDCSWNMFCGSENIYFGSDFSTPIVPEIKIPADKPDNRYEIDLAKVKLKAQYDFARHKAEKNAELAKLKANFEKDKAKLIAINEEKAKQLEAKIIELMEEQERARVEKELDNEKIRALRRFIRHLCAYFDMEPPTGI